MTDPSRFAARLKELRERAGLTQGELAQRAGLTKDGVAHLEQGRREPSWSTVLALGDALSVGCQAFTEEPSPRPQAKPGRPPKATPAPELNTDQAPRLEKPGDSPAPQRKPTRRKPPRPRGGSRR
jgi:transcriptional regulator with XRE-family HTH domain